MLGVLNTSCKWEKALERNKYNEISYAAPVVIPCAINKEPRLTITDTGLLKTEDTYYVLHTPVSDDDLIDGVRVAVTPILSHSGELLWYKAVTLNG